MKIYFYLYMLTLFFILPLFGMDRLKNKENDYRKKLSRVKEKYSLFRNLLSVLEEQRESIEERTYNNVVDQVKFANNIERNVIVLHSLRRSNDFENHLIHYSISR